MKNLLMAVPLTLGLVACSSGGSNYQSIKGTAKPDLNTQQENAVTNVTASSSSTGQGALTSGVGSTSYILAMTRAYATSLKGEQASQKSLPASRSIDAQSVSTTHNCEEGGSVAVTGSFSGSVQAGSDNAISSNIDADATITGSNCTSSDGAFDGSLTVSMGFDISLSGYDSSTGKYSSGSMTFVTDIAGTASGKGKDDDGVLRDISIVFNDFSAKLSLDASKFDDAENLASDTSDDTANIDFLKENLTCSGTVTVDGKELSCAEFLIVSIEDEGLAAKQKPSISNQTATPSTPSRRIAAEVK